jgi:hypothetical protein
MKNEIYWKQRGLRDIYSDRAILQNEVHKKNKLEKTRMVNNVEWSE